MATMKDIAQLAECSLGTVDRALNNKPGVSQKTRARILEIAASLQYKPNKVGQKLVNRSKRNSLLGVILHPIENPFFDCIKTGIELAAEELSDEGVATDIYCMNTYKDTEMCALLEHLEESGVSGVVLNGINSPLIHQKLEAMHQKGIKIVTCSSDVEVPFRNCFVGFPHEKSGRVAAELMTKFSATNGRFLVIIGQQNIFAHQKRAEGFALKLSEAYPDASVVDIIEVSENDEIALKKTFDALTEHPEINGIYVTCYGIKGVLDAVQLKRPDTHTPIICYDGSPVVRNAVKNGLVDVTIFQDPVKQGKMALQILYDCIIRPRDTTAKQYLTKVDIRINENIDD